MKRIALAAIFLIGACMLAVVRPDLVSPQNLMAVIIIMLVIIIVSLVAYPVTEYVTREKRVEVAIPNSFRYGIGQFREVDARFIIEFGDPIEGILVGRSDRYGTFTIRPLNGDPDVTIPQATLKRVETYKDNTPKSALEWDETSDLLVPRSC